MGVFLAAFLAVLLAETGGRTQLLTAALATRFQRDRWVIAALLLAMLINVALAAYLGSLIHVWIGPNARIFLYALACLFTGLTMLATQRQTDEPAVRLGAFSGSFLALFLSMLGDRSQFLIGAITARIDTALLAALGGFLGIAIACVPAVILRDGIVRSAPLLWVQRIGGAAFTLLGIGIALAALGLI